MQVTTVRSWADRLRETVTESTRASGITATFGGALIVVSGLLMLLRPEGSVVQGGVHREASDLLVMMHFGQALVVPALAALGARRGHLGRAGTALAVVGLVDFAVTGLLVAALGTLAAMPFFVGFGVLTLLGGVLATAVAAGRTETLPPLLAVSLAVGTLVLFGFNTENWQAIFLTPYGLAWVAVGRTLWRGRFPPTH